MKHFFLSFFQKLTFFFYSKLINNLQIPIKVHYQSKFYQIKNSYKKINIVNISRHSVVNILVQIQTLNTSSYNKIMQVLKKQIHSKHLSCRYITASCIDRNINFLPFPYISSCNEFESCLGFRVACMSIIFSLSMWFSYIRNFFLFRKKINK